MFVGVGVLAPVAGVFHLVTHAFFKALLFLALRRGDARDAGRAGHAQDDRPEARAAEDALADADRLPGAGGRSRCSAGSSRRTRSSPPRGTRSRAARAGHAAVTAFLTAYYTFRLYFRVFEGPTGSCRARAARRTTSRRRRRRAPDRRTTHDAHARTHARRSSQPRAGDHDPAAGRAGDRRDVRGLLNCPRRTRRSATSSARARRCIGSRGDLAYNAATSADAIANPVPFGQPEVTRPATCSGTSTTCTRCT